MANRYSKKNKPRQIEPVPLITTLIVLGIVIFIGIDATIGENGGPVDDNYVLRIELYSETHTNLNGTLTFDARDGIYEQLWHVKNIPTFTSKRYGGTYDFSFDGEGVSFGPISITVSNMGIVYQETVNDIDIRIDALEG